MRALLTAFGTLGDVCPLVALGRALVERGHAVHLVASPRGAAFAQRSGLSAAPLGWDVEALLAAAAAGDHGLLQAMRTAWPAQIEAQADRLAAHAPWADLLVGGVGALTASSVADAHQRPFRALLFCPRALPSAEHAPMAAPFSTAPRWLNRLSWWLEGALLDHPAGASLARRRAAWGLPPLPHRHAALQPPGRTWVLADPELFPLAADVDAEAVGYWPLPRPPEALPEALERFLAAGPPPVWVGWGSMVDPEPARTAAMVVAALRRAGLRGVLGLGAPAEARLALPASIELTEIHFAAAVDHRALFPRLAGALHHGGAGTVATAARAGIPQAVLWHLPDQKVFGEGLRAAGLGPAPLAFSRRSEEGLWSLLEGLAPAAAPAQAMGERLRARDPLGAAVARLERLAEGAQPSKGVAWMSPPGAAG